MGATKNFGSIKLRNSALGSVALGMLVVGAGAVPIEWTVAQPSRQVATALVATPEVRRPAASPVKWAKRAAPSKLTAASEREFTALPAETAVAVAPAAPVLAVGPVAMLPASVPAVSSVEAVALVAPSPIAAPVAATPRADTLALVVPSPIAVAVAPRAEMAALVAQLPIAAPTPAASSVEMAALVAQLPIAAPAAAIPRAETVALVAPIAEPIAEPTMQTVSPAMPVEEAGQALVSISNAKPVAPVAAMRPAMSDLIHVDQISALAPMAPSSAAGFAVATPFSATPNGISEAIYIEQISAVPPARFAPQAVRAASQAAKPAVLAPVTVTKLAKASTPSPSASGERYKVTARGLEMNMAVVVNGTPGGRVSLVIDSNNAISMRLSDVLGLVRPLMDDATFARLNATGAAQDYLSFATLRSAGLDLRYDAGLDRLFLAVAAHD
ncbi:MAG: hypothetical protein EOO76_12395 [Novosphingobium sp.]|nr:MAG: hypothetical protein EOO76_12395 [Novosphingobium sp.]